MKTTKRTAAAISQSGYSQGGASYKKAALKGFRASSNNAVEDIDQNNATLRQRSRILYMSQPLATSAVKINRTNVVGEGLRLRSKIDRDALGLTLEQADQWQQQTEREFLLWASSKRADASGINDFFELQQLALISWLTSGDVFCALKQTATDTWHPYGLALQLIEADRISTPFQGKAASLIWTEGQNPDNGNKIHDGVEVDKNGRAVAFWICDQYPHEFTLKAANWQRIEIMGKNTGLLNILQIMDSERPGQYRGVPFLAQVIEPLLNLKRYTESELMAALIESMFTAWITTTGRTDEMPVAEALPGDELGFNIGTTETATGGLPDPNDFKMGPGTTHVLAPGEGVTFGDPKRPASGFPAFVRAIAEQTGAALEIPADILCKSFSSSYSASRGALLEAWKAFRMRRRWFVSDFCQPVFEAWLAEAVALGRIQAPGFFEDPSIRRAWCAAEWTGPAQGQLDPVKEIQAEQLACEQGFTTREQSTIRLNGGNFARNIETLQKENESMQKVLINAEQTIIEE